MIGTFLGMRGRGMFRLFPKVISIVGLVLAASGGVAVAAGRVALVVGNGAYQSLATLANPSADAGELGRALSANGFEVLSCDGKRRGCFDLTREGLQDALETLTHKAKGKDLALVFFSGHGMEGADGNVLAPIDMRVDCAENMVRRGVLLNDMLKAVAGARQKIVILDACRSNPLPQCPGARGFVAASFGELSVPDAESFLLVSSTKPGQVALDGLPGEHSPFARALLHWLDKSPDIYFQQVLSHVAKMVIEDTTRAKFTQVPEMLVRGVPPETCLKGQGCTGDPQASALRAELDALKAERLRDQDLMQIASAYLAKFGVRSVGKPLSEEDKHRVLAGIEDAGRALASRADDRGEQALKRLSEGDATEAERLFVEVLELETKAATKRNKNAADASRHLAALAKPKDVARAVDYYRRAAELDPESAENWLDYAFTAEDAGDTTAAVRAFEAALERTKSENALLLRVKANGGLGEVAMIRGNLTTARGFFETALATIAPYAAVRADDLEAQKLFSDAHESIGYVLRLQGNLPGTLEAYNSSLAIRVRLAKADPSNARWQRDLAGTHNNIGDVLEAQGNLTAALENYQVSRAIMERVVKADPGNSDWGSALSSSNSNIGGVLQAQGNLQAALEAYKASLAIRDRLARGDPTNSGWQNDLAKSHENVGDVLQVQGNSRVALEAYKASLAIRDRLAKGDPTNTDWQWALGGVHERIGGVFRGQGDLPSSLASYRTTLNIAETLLRSDRSNTGWQRDLSVAHEKIGGVLQAQGNLRAALEAYKASLAIRDRLAKGDPTNTGWQNDLATSQYNIGRALREQGKLPAALESYRAAHAIFDRLAKADPGNAGWQNDLAKLHVDVGGALRDQGNLPAALESYRAAHAIFDRLAKADPGNVGWQSDLAANCAKLGGLYIKLNRRDSALEMLRTGRAIVAALAAHSELQRWKDDLDDFDREIAALERHRRIKP